MYILVPHPYALEVEENRTKHWKIIRSYLDRTYGPTFAHQYFLIVKKSASVKVKVPAVVMTKPKLDDSPHPSCSKLGIQTA
jgi:hypothetical protein